MVNGIQKEIRPLTEAMNLLCMAASQKTLEDYKEEIAKNAKCNKRFESVFSILKEIDADTKAALKDKWEDVLFYFGAEDWGGERLTHILYLWESNLPLWYATPKEWSDSILMMEESEYYKNVYHRLCVYNNSVQDVVDVKFGESLAEVIAFILKMDIPDEKKLELQDIILNREAHFEKVNQLLERALKQITKYQKQIQEWISVFGEYWVEELGGKSFPDYMEEIFHFKEDIERPIEEWTLWPCVFVPTRMGVTFDMDPETGKVNGPCVGTAGILFGEGYTIRDCYESETTLSDEQALKTLRLISEKNKFEILSLTKEAPAYGSVLAQHLGLTTATISHHTNELYEAHLLNLEKKGNRIYYSTNEEMLRKLIRYLEGKLT